MRRSLVKWLHSLLITGMLLQLLPAAVLEAVSSPRSNAGGVAQSPPPIPPAPKRGQTSSFFADVDGDQDVDGVDLGIVAQAWNCANDDDCFDPALDFNADGLISAFDLARVGNEFDIDPPLLTVSSPAEGSVLAGDSVHVSGTVQDIHGATVTVNGVAATINGQNWQATAPVTAGNVALQITAVDGVGQARVVSRLIAVDQAGPFIKILAPRHRQSVYTERPTVEIHFRDFDSTVNPASLQVTVQAFDGSTPQNVTADLTVNADSATGQLSTLLAADHSYTLTVTLNDSLGNPSTVATNLYVPLDAASITPPVEIETAGWVSGVVYDSRGCDADLVHCPGLAGVAVTLQTVDETALHLAQESRARSLAGQHRFSARLTSGEEALTRAAFTPITGTVVTGPDGFFAFPVAASGRYALRAEKTGFTYGQRMADIVRERSTPTNDIFLTPLDAAVTVCDTDGCFHASADGQMEVEIPPGAIRAGESVDVTATEFDRVYFLPSGELPPGTWETYAFNLGGDSDYQFETPVTVRLKNSRGFAPGTEIPLGFWNQTLFQWEHEGVATVSGDGVWVEMALTHFSNHDPNFPVTPGSARPISQDKTKKDDECAEGQKGNSEVTLRSGFLQQTFTLPGVDVLGQVERLGFRYSSGRADFTEIIEAALALESSGGLDLDGFVQAELFIEGQKTANFTFAAAALQNGGEIGQFRFLWDGRDAQGNQLPPGAYRFGLRIRIPYTAQFFASANGQFGGPPDFSRPIGRTTQATVDDFVFGSVLVTSAVDSPFGAGWMLDGQQRLYEDESGRILIDDGCNVDEFYFPAKNLTLPPAGTQRSADEPMRGIFQEEEIGDWRLEIGDSQGYETGTEAKIGTRIDTDVADFHGSTPHNLPISQSHNLIPRRKAPGLGKFLLRPVGENIGGTVITDTVLSLANSPYILTGDLVIAAGVAVTVEAGVVITGSLNEEIRVLGHLEAVGTAGAPIRFSAINTSRWDGIFFDGGTGNLRHVQVGVTSASNSANRPAAVSVRNVLTGEVRIEQSRVHNSNASGVSAVNSRVVLDGVEIDRNGFNTGFGLLADGTSEITVRNSAFHDNFRTPLNIRPQHLTGFVDNVFANNSPNRAEIGGGSFTSAIHLSNFGLDEIRLTGDWTVPAGITLTLEAGTILNSNPSVEIRVQGHLAAAGEAGNRVHFRGAGGWDGLIFDGGTGLLRQIALNNTVVNGIRAQNVLTGEVRIEESRIHANRQRALDVVNSRVVIAASEFDNNNFAGGSEGIRVDGNSHFFVSNSSFHDNKDVPLSLPAQHLPNLRDNVYTNNVNGTVDNNRIEIRGGVLITSTTLAEDSGVEYRLINSMTVTRGVTLTIGAGNFVRGNADTELRILGHLHTEGREDNPVRLGVAQPRRWNGLVIDGGSALLQHTRVEGGGGDDFSNSLGRRASLTAQDVDGEIRMVGGTLANSNPAGLHVTRSRVVLEGVDVHSNGGDGILAVDSQVEVIGGSLRNTPTGLRVQGNAAGVVVHLADIRENSNFGIRNEGTGVVDARFNFWGHPSGPLHPTLNPGGQGSRVSDNVLFEPRLEAPGADAGIQNQTETDFSTLTFDQATGTYTRHYLDGSFVHFDAGGRHDFTQDPQGNRTTYRYNPDGTVAAVEMSAAGRAGADWRWDFSEQSSVISGQPARTTEHRFLITDPAGRITTLTLDDRGDLVALDRPGYGAPRRFAYDSNHRMTHKTDEGGFTTTYVYGDHGRLQGVILPPRPVFNPATTTVEVIAERRSFTPSDVAYQLVNDLAPGAPNAPTDALVQGAALVDKVTLGRGGYRTLSNEWGSPLAQTDAIGRQTRYERDEADLITKEISPEGNCTEYTYDERGNPLQRIEIMAAACALPSNQRAAAQIRGWRYTYEPRFNQVKTETDPNGNVTTYVYDYEDGAGDAGRLIRLVRPAVDDGDGNVVPPTLRYTYNAQGQKLTTTDARGSVTRYVYTTGEAAEAGAIFADGVSPVPGLLTQVIRDEGRLGATMIYRQFDAAGNAGEVIDANGGVTRRTYDDANRLATSVDPLGRVTKYEYDAKGNLARRIDDFSEDGVSGRNVTTIFDYDALDRLLSRRTDADGISQQTSQSYDINGNLATVTDSNGFRTRYEYDDANQLSAIVDPLGQRLQYRYNGRGELVEMVEADGVITQVRYDDFGRVEQEIKDVGGLALTAVSAYDAWGNLIRHTDPVGTVTCAEYDALNRVIRQVRDCDGLQLPTTYRYNLNGEEVERVNVQGLRTRTVYDALGRPTQQTLSGAAVDRVNVYSYDAIGNLIRMVDERGTVTEHSYNLRNLLLEARQDTTGLNLITRYSYDRLDNPQSVTDAEGIVTRTDYNAFGKLTRQVADFAALTTHRNAATTYHYDNNLNLIAVTDANGNTTGYDYDARNSQIRVRYADGTSVSYTYTADRLMASRTDQAGDRVEMIYDGANRLVERRYPSGAVQTFAYDPADRRILAEQVMDGHSTRWQWSYNAPGDVVSSQQVVDGQGFTTLYAYDYPANTRTTTYPSGAVVVHRQDGLDRAVQVQMNDHEVARYVYNDQTGVIGLTHSNGVASQISMDALNRIERVTTSGPGGTLADYAYGYNDVGLRTLAQHLHKPDAPADLFTYDGLYQINDVLYQANATTLDAVTGQEGRQQFDLDGVGNRLIVTTDGVAERYQPIAGNRLADPMNRYEEVGATALRYDAKGNLSGDGVHTFAYDFENRQIGVDGPAGSVDYVFDALGNRVARLVNGQRTLYLYDDQRQVIEERDTSNAPTLRVIYGGDLDEPLLLERGTTVSHLHRDAQGNISEATSANGQLVERYRYDAFGQAHLFDGGGNPIAASAIGNPYLYTARRLDPESGNYHFRARSYSPALGRFLQMDPKGYVDGMNLYANYFDVNARDPLGTDVWIENTTAVMGFHRRICVNRRANNCLTKSDFKYCVAFGAISPNDFKTDPTLERPAWGSGPTSSAPSLEQGGSSNSGSSDAGGSSHSDSSEGQGWLNIDNSNGQIGNGIVYEDNSDQATKQWSVIKSECCDDREIMKFLKSLVGKRGNYNLCTWNCRDWASATHAQIVDDFQLGYPDVPGYTLLLH